jgi:transposase-like protein
MIFLCDHHATRGKVTMAVSFKGAHFPQDIILSCVRWYVAYPLSYRHVEELMEERGVDVDHATINRWVVKCSPQLEAAFHRRKRSVWISGRLDETYMRVKGERSRDIISSHRARDPATAPALDHTTYPIMWE